MIDDETPVSQERVFKNQVFLTGSDGVFQMKGWIKKRNYSKYLKIFKVKSTFLPNLPHLQDTNGINAGANMQDTTEKHEDTKKQAMQFTI